MDIGGTPAAALVAQDSNPGTVSLRPGGVGRNIAHDLCLMGASVSLIAAVGGDVYGTAIMESCRAIGMDMSMSLLLPERRSSTYLYVNDEKGDMHVAISDMEISKCITAEYLAPLMERINAADAVVVDANLERETIEFICNNCTVPVYSDPVSTVKAMKLQGVMDKLFCLKPNAIEAEKLTGIADAAASAAALVKRGVHRVFVSCGADGMIAADSREVIKVPTAVTELVNTNGAGDAAAAAIIMAGVNGMSLRESAELAMKASALICSCVEANSPKLGEIF